MREILPKAATVQPYVLKPFCIPKKRPSPVGRKIKLDKCEMCVKDKKKVRLSWYLWRWTLIITSVNVTIDCSHTANVYENRNCVGIET